MKPVSVLEFLEAVEPVECELLPVAHSTTASNLFDIANASKLRLSTDGRFKKDLLYLFVGRPAYKTKSESEASYWQCPAVFVFRDVSKLSTYCIHPFDTGAFLDELLPAYLRIFPLERFNLGNECEIIGKLIRTFFGDSESYMKGRSLGAREFETRYGLTVRHQEIEALTRLYNDKPSTFDDRGKCIEVQVEQDIELTRGSLIGVVMPHPYSQDTELISKFNEIGCRIEAYPIFPNNVEGYYTAIYERVKKIIDEAAS